MICRRGKTAGESAEPVKTRRTGVGGAIEPPIEVKVTSDLLNWRKLLCQTQLQGLAREIASGSELVRLTDSEVVLRPISHTLVTQNTKQEIQNAIVGVKGTGFHVNFAPEEKSPQSTTVSLLEEAERRAARIAMIEAFKSDPFVQQCVNVFNGTIDETSVRLLTETEIEELEHYARKHPGLARPGTKDAKKC